MILHISVSAIMFWMIGFQQSFRVHEKNDFYNDMQHTVPEMNQKKKTAKKRKIFHKKYKNNIIFFKKMIVYQYKIVYNKTG